MKKQLAVLALMTFLLGACNQGDYSYTQRGYDNCRCGGGDEFTCSMRAIGDVLFNPMVSRDARNTNEHEGYRCR